MSRDGTPLDKWDARTAEDTENALARLGALADDQATPDGSLSPA